MYGIDNWSANAESHKQRNKDDQAYNETLDNLKTYIDSGQFIIIRKTSMDALINIPDGSLDFVFIDADHTYDAVKEDINGWTPKVRFGGIVSGHDYYEFGSGKGGIIPAVDEYVKENEYSLQLTNWDKKNPDRDSRQPCWFFIK